MIERSETTYRMNADGTGERDVHAVIRIQSAGAAQQFGVLAFSYASAYETPTIKILRVTKPDGSVVNTPAADAIQMTSAVSREAPLYSDLKELHIPVRSLSPGDTLEYEVDTRIFKAETPGQFWGTDHFTPPGTVIVLAEILHLQVPAGKFVQVWSPNHKPVISDQNGVRTYTWNLPQLIPAPRPNANDSEKPTPPQDPDQNADGENLPSVAWTTFHSWSEVGDWYRNLALKQSAPTDAIRAKADQITAGAKTPEDQVRDLYDFVSAHIRYVGIDFGIGRYQPHTAAEVLANQYGDCKDKDTLLEALLRARGFSTAPALIGAGIAPVPDVPTPAVFNHVITTVNLPGGRIWLDSTPPDAPFQYLSAAIRDQKALVVSADKPALLEATPAAAPYPFSAQFEAVGTLDAQGKLTAKMTATYRDDDEALVRALANAVAPADWDKISQYIAAQTGFSGTTSDTQFQNIDDSTKPIVMTYDYERHPFGDWDNHRIVPLFPALEFPNLESDSKEPQHDIQLGAPRTLTAITKITLPAGFRPNLPDPIHVKAAYATFDKTYSYEGDQIVVHRKIVILQKKIAKAEWKQYQAFTKNISLSSESWIALSAPLAPPTGTEAGNTKLKVVKKSTDGSGVVASSVPPPPSAAAAAPASPSTSNASAATLVAEAASRLVQRDWSGARDLLDQAKAKDEHAENLWSMYGFIAEVESHDYEQAKTDFRKELESHPDNPAAVGGLAEAENRTGESAAAREGLRNYLKRHPENERMALYLAALQNQAEDYQGALKTLQSAAASHPSDRYLQLRISDALLRLGRNEEAAAAAESVLDGTDDPNTLNDAAYQLAESGLDLNVAEAASRKSIAALEEKSAEMTTQQVNSNAFAQANLLVASWDTLGWILFREGKPEAALPYISSAWRASLLAEGGDHLGQVLEALGRKHQAVNAYALASAALTPGITPSVRNHIQESLARLKSAGLKPTTGSAQALQDVRTYKIKRPAGASGWGAFRLEITTAGVLQSQQMSGDPKLAALKPLIDAMKFPELLPPDSKAHLLRSAVVSCSMGKTCQLVLVPDGGLQTEQQ
ncbi:MAG: DUF3857 domain-containing protein [Acidobacteriota bacterium]